VSDDDLRPRITRTRPNSLFRPSVDGRRSTVLGGGPSPLYTDPFDRPSFSGGFDRRDGGRRSFGGVAPVEQAEGELKFFPVTDPENPLASLPSDYEFVRVGRGGIYARRKSESGRDSYGGSFDDGTGRRPTAYNEAPPNAVSRGGQTVNGVRVYNRGEATEDETARIQQNAQTDSVFNPLNLDIPPDLQFRFDRGEPIADIATGERQYGPGNMLQDRGVVPRDGGGNENLMTLSAGVLWLRNLAARDRTTYNDMVVALRNAGYGNLPDDDRLLPFNGYTQQVGVAFVQATNDLAQANAGGDDRTLLEYLTDRGQGYLDYIAQKEADEAPKPVDREYQDPATLAAAAKAAAVQALGRKLTDEEEARFEAAFRSQENTFYNAIDTAQQNETAFSGYRPDVAGQVDAFLDGPGFDTERAANSIGEYAQTFLRLVGG
jgi:hypothetical protein